MWNTVTISPSAPEQRWRCQWPKLFVQKIMMSRWSWPLTFRKSPPFIISFYVKFCHHYHTISEIIDFIMFCEVTVTSDLWVRVECVWWRLLMWLFWKLHHFGALNTLDIGALQRVSRLFSSFPYIQLSTCSFWLGRASTLLFLHKLTCVPNMNKLPQTFLRYHHHKNGKDRGTRCMYWWMDRRSENITSAAQSHKIWTGPSKPRSSCSSHSGY